MPFAVNPRMESLKIIRWNEFQQKTWRYEFFTKRIMVEIIGRRSYAFNV